MLLSVNLNKVALLRNSRGADHPGPLSAARTCLDAGAQGITLHLREDRRHAREQDVHDISRLCAERGAEFNLEGNARPELIALALEVLPKQMTLVPTRPGEITSDHGWDLPRSRELLSPLVEQLKGAGVRVALFMDPEPEQMELAADTGADRVEIYTGPYASVFGGSAAAHALECVRLSALAARRAGLGVNAGHDLNLVNLSALARAVPEIGEVSIGHALIADALYLGLAETVRRYLAAARGEDVIAVRDIH